MNDFLGNSCFSRSRSRLIGRLMRIPSTGLMISPNLCKQHRHRHRHRCQFSSLPSPAANTTATTTTTATNSIPSSSGISNGKTSSRRGGTTSGPTAVPSLRPGSSSHATTQTSPARYVHCKMRVRTRCSGSIAARAWRCC